MTRGAGHSQRTNRIRNYTFWQRLWEDAQHIATSSGWPARFAARLGHTHSVSVDHHDVRVAGSLGDADRLRIAFASDFHAGPTTSPALIEQAIAQLRGANADVLLLGGDFVSLRADYARDLVSQLADVPAPLGRYAVLGNHDHWAGGAAITAHLRRVGIEVLTNRNMRLPHPFSNVSICGVDDHTSGEPNAEAAFTGSAAVRIVLMHAPSGMLDIGERSFAVAFCGHTHGGQIALPNGRPLIVAKGRLSRRYNAGRFDLDNERTLLVSRGIGFSTVPFRWNAPPHVITCMLQGTP
jgi:predicted MPP superfamily phosphohydrolase